MSSLRNYGWPDWLLSIDESLSQALHDLENSREILDALVSSDLKYQTPANYQFHQVSQRFSKLGRSASRTEVAVVIAQNGTTYTLCRTAVFRHTTAVSKLLNIAHESLSEGDILIPFICFRSVIEHTACFDNLISKLTALPMPRTFAMANETLEKMNEAVDKSLLGTRIQWSSLLRGGTLDLASQENLVYFKREDRGDIAAVNCMTALTKLDKKISGVKTGYEILCEFAHPNVGALLLAGVTDTASETDEDGVIWHKKTLTRRTPPILFGSALLIAEVKLVAQCLEHLIELNKDMRIEELKVLKVTQMVVRKQLENNPSAVSSTSQCPCGSGKKVKRCCGH